jgi:hypothetical protein
MPAHLTPGSKYHGWHRKYRQNRMSINQSGPKRRRVCFYLKDELAAWLAIWAGSVRASQSHVVEGMLERMRKEEDPDGIGGFELYD